MIASAEEFVRLRSSEDREDYHRAAHEEAPLAVWEDLIARFPAMRFWVAQNKTVPGEVLAVLARDADVAVRTMVAMKRSLSPDLQLLLARDADEGVRHRLAMNAKADRSVLELLARDATELVRSAAAKRL